MVAIVGIHGIGHQFQGGYSLRTMWFDALRDGLVRANRPAAAEALRANDLRVAFFGDLFRPSGAMAAQGPPFTAADIQSGPERDLLTALFDAATIQDPSLDAPQGSMGVGMRTINIMLSRLAQTQTLSHAAQRAFVGNLKQVTAFLTEASIKMGVLTRVHESIDADTRVVIGHSLGSVVAYEYLCHYQPPGLEKLITLGSPLGIPNVIFDKLTPRPIAGTGAWPGAVSSWVNVADSNDFVALRKDLAPLFVGSAGRKISDQRVSNGDQPHAVERYLNARQTGAALAEIFPD